MWMLVFVFIVAHVFLLLILLDRLGHHVMMTTHIGHVHLVGGVILVLIILITIITFIIFVVVSVVLVVTLHLLLLLLLLVLVELLLLLLVLLILQEHQVLLLIRNVLSRVTWEVSHGHIQPIVVLST